MVEELLALVFELELVLVLELELVLVLELELEDVFELELDEVLLLLVVVVVFLEELLAEFFDVVGLVGVNGIECNCSKYNDSITSIIESLKI